MIARSGDGANHDEWRVTNEEIAQLKQVFNEPSLFSENKLTHNRE